MFVQKRHRQEEAATMNFKGRTSTAALDPVTGPIPRDTFNSLVAAPHGEALKTIRKFDPLFGRAPGEKIKWEITFEREATETGHATVEAASEKEAEALADKLKDSEIDWEPDFYGDSGTITSVEPKGGA